MQAKKVKAVDDLHQLYGPFEDVVLTKSGGLLSGISLLGCDADALSEDDRVGLSFIAQDTYQRLTNDYVVTQLYIQHDQVSIDLLPRQHPITDLLRDTRQQYLNQQRLTQSHLYHYLEKLPDVALYQLNWQTFLDNIKRLRQNNDWHSLWRQYFSEKKGLCLEQQMLHTQLSQLKDSLREVSDRWRLVTEVSTSNNADLWRQAKFLASCNPCYLTMKTDLVPPDQHWDCLLNDGNVSQITHKHVELIRLQGEQTYYARIASIVGFDQRNLISLWTRGYQRMVDLDCNVVICLRWRPMSSMQRSLMLKHKANEWERASLNYYSMLTGNEQQTTLQKQLLMNPVIVDRLKALQSIESLEEPLGRQQMLIMTFSKNPDQVIANSQRINKASNAINLHMVWESQYLLPVYESMQLGYQQKNLRDIIMTSSQMAATSLLYKPSRGQRSSSVVKGEEAHYIHMTKSGNPFYYNAYLETKPLLIGIGPVGSGKSFFKCVQAAHFLKYEGMLYCIDIDHGSETLAQLYQSDAGIFRINNDSSQGFNPFETCSGSRDQHFFRHIKNLLLGMIRSNEQVDLQQLSNDEQHALEQAIVSVMHLPKDMQSLGALSAHLSLSLVKKLSRWLFAHNDHQQDGIYAHFFDQMIDAIGAMDKKIAVFNLQDIKSSVAPLALVMQEIFYRVTRVFESNENLAIPKSLEIDEAHHFLKNPSNVEFLIESIRTWRKYRAGVSLWSQGVRDFTQVADWEVLKAAAGTFVFMADPSMNVNEYREAFDLTHGQCLAIKSLIPRQEAFIYQPSLGIAKRVQLNVDPVHYTMATSTPSEVILRNEYIKQYGVKDGLQKMANKIIQITHKESSNETVF